MTDHETAKAFFKMVHAQDVDEFSRPNFLDGSTHYMNARIGRSIISIAFNDDGKYEHMLTTELKK